MVADPTHAGLRRAAEHAVRRNRAGMSLIASLCAGALAPVAAAAAAGTAIDPVIGASFGVVGSVGANVLTEVISAAIARLRGAAGHPDTPLDPAAVERVLTEGLEQALRGSVGEALRESAAAILRAPGAMEAVLDGAASVGPDAAVTLAQALAALGGQFGEFAGVAADLRSVVVSLNAELARSAAERRAGAARAGEQGLVLGRILDAVEGRASRGSREPAWVDCPYLGLAPFRTQDARVFYGRRDMTRRLVRAVAEHAHSGGLLVVLGPSGAGKSSLLQAGLAPAVAREELGPEPWTCRVITPTARPLLELAAQLADLCGREAGEIAQTLTVAPRRAAGFAAAARSRLLLVVDQFEEVFNDVDGRGSREAFVAAIDALSSAAPDDGEPPAVVVLTVRGDFLDQAVAFEPIANAVTAGAFVVGPMSRADLKEAVLGPAVEAGVSVEPKLLKAVLREAYDGTSAGTGVLPLVSQAMAVTWHACGGGQLTLRAYHRAGGLADAAHRSAEETYGRLDKRQQQAARAMFLHLTRTTRDGRVVRRASTRADLYTVAKVSTPDGELIVDAFAARRLLVLDGDQVQICHDVLLDSWRTLHDWQQGDAADRVLYSDVITDAGKWESQNHNGDYLYRPRELQAVSAAEARWTDDHDRYPALPATTTAFLSSSRRAVRRAVHRRVVAFATVVVVALVACGAAFVAIRSAAEAQAEQAVALSRELAVESASLVSINPALAAQLAVTAWEVSPTTQAAAAMSSLLSQQEQTSTFPTPAGGISLAFSPNGRMLAAASEDGKVRLLDPASGRSLRSPISSKVAGERGMAFSPDSQTLALAGADGAVRLLDPAGGGPARTSIPGLAASVAFSPSGRVLAIGGADGTMRLYDRATDRQVEVKAGSQAIMSVAFSEDGARLVTGDLHGMVRLFDAASGWPVGPPPFIADEEQGMHRNPPVLSVGFAPDGKTVLAASQFSVARYDAITGEPVGSMMRGVGSVAISSDFTRIAINTDADTAQVFDIVSGAAVGPPGVLVAPQQEPALFGVNAMALSPNGKTLAALDTVGSVRLMDIASGRPLLAAVTIPDTPPNSAIDAGITTIAYSSDGSLLAAGGSDGNVQVLDALTGRSAGAPMTVDDETPTTVTEEYFAVASVAFSPDGRTLAAVATSGKVKQFDPNTGRVVGTPVDLPTDRIARVVEFSPDGRLLAVGCADGTAWLVLAATGRPLGPPLVVDDVNRPTTEVGQADNLREMAFSTDSRTLVVLGGSDNKGGATSLFDITNGQTQPKTINTFASAHSALALSPHGQTVAVAGIEGPVRMYDTTSKRPVGTQIFAAVLSANIVKYNVDAMAFSPNGQTLATAGSDGRLQLFDVATGQQLGGPVTMSTTNLRSVTFSPDGSTVATADHLNTVQRMPVWVFGDPATQLCAEVGLVSDADWKQYAPNEREPARCGD